MKKISFNGKEYVRASEAAKKFRYTQDYVGQLCRNKKVDARRVGRNWYVTIDSISSYRKTKHQTQKNTRTEVSKKKSSSHRNSAARKRNPKRVEPVLRTKTIKNTKPKQPTHKNTGVQYSPDGGALIPILAPESKQGNVSIKRSHKVRLERSPAVALPVSSPKTETNFSSEKLPEISLSGKLSVVDSTEDRPFDDSEKDAENGLEVIENNEQDVDEIEGEIDAVAATSNTGSDQLEENVVTKEVGQIGQIAPFTPTSISKSTVQNTIGMYTVVGAFLAAFLIGFMMLTIGNEVVVTPETSSQSWQFDIPSLLQ